MEYIVDTEKLELNLPFKALYKGQRVVIYKTTKGIFAVEDRCSHEEYPLSNSIANKDATIECENHGAMFDLVTGKALRLPALLPVKTFSIIIQDQKIYISD